MDVRRYGPFIHTEKNDAYISASHLLSLIPVMAVAVVYYGLRAGILILFCALLFTASDTVCAKIRKVSRGSILNPLFCGAVFALLLPPDTPLYIAFTGIMFASVVVRQIPGGRGASIVNPAAAGRLFVRIVFPNIEGAFAYPGDGLASVRSLLSGSNGFGGFDLQDYSTSEIVMGRYPSFIGTACAFMIITGIGYLLMKKAVRFYGPVCYIGMLIVLLLIRDFRNESSDTWLFVVTSGVLFTAAYLLFDEETTRSFGTTSIVSAFICAALTFLMSFKAAGIDLIVIPVVLTGVLTGILDYAGKIMRVYGEDEAHV